MSIYSIVLSTVYNECPYFISCERVYGTLQCDGKRATMRNCEGWLEGFAKGKRDSEIWEVLK